MYAIEVIKTKKSPKNFTYLIDDEELYTLEQFLDSLIIAKCITDYKIEYMEK